MNFSQALDAVKQGKKIAREGWNGKGLFVIYVPGTLNVKPTPGTPYANALSQETVNIQGHLDLFTSSKEMQPGWLATQSDLLSEDWEVVE